ncbi:30S ribosomal protein S7 [Candidatus Roizmanbacteria bacterium CG10_big_fil_rev_8_21_14_0_10_45_7]|uniref:Small ribosomal subunit protein uS7 n=1 Tax=Candidatus Roizmanbacteria bacterium CG10_big_fil_rev_8_21_14_0_10_45_7 TaxID=1974854 RepID=A0A2M8KVN0_9BACT|nr:MAG: 30S ribosomal protein S7 [Candidatus Roizmanbacteria bacterium CG10_big_fil_rev_8_21_14_0_10_45_7]
MPRRAYAKRKAQPDAQYQSLAVAKLINLIMESGKKMLAERIVYDMMAEIEKEKKMAPMEVLDTAIANIGPRFIVRPRRVGGASYMVPREVTPHHRLFLAMRWLVDAARERSNKEYKTFSAKLKAEVLDGYDKKGAAFDKKMQSEKLAEANKVFAHFNW